MVQESSRNIRYVCRECASRPNPELLKNIKLSDLIGKNVKISFDCDEPEKIGDKEHMWIEVTQVQQSGWITGTLSNDPICCSYIKYGDIVHFSKDQIEDISIE